MHFHVKRKFHEEFSLDTIIKELSWYQKRQVHESSLDFLQCLELNELNACLLTLELESNFIIRDEDSTCFSIPEWEA